MTRTHGETARLHRYLADRDTSDQYNTHRLALDDETPTGRNTMSEITIKRIGGMGNDGYWLASDGVWSPDNGANWVCPKGDCVLLDRDYILALKLHLDSLATEAEPERAKAGDWVRVDDDHFSGQAGKVVEVRRVDGDGNAWIDDVPGGIYGKGGVCIGDGVFVIVPPPEPETFTGDPIKDEWGEGVYVNKGQGIFVCVGDGEAFGMSARGVIFEHGWEYGCDFIRISDDPAVIINPDLLGGG